MLSGQLPQVVRPVPSDCIDYEASLSKVFASRTYPKKPIGACYGSIRPLYSFVERSGIGVEEVTPMTCSFLSSCGQIFCKRWILPQRGEAFGGPGILWRPRCLNRCLRRAKTAAQASTTRTYVTSWKRRTAMSRYRGMCSSRCNLHAVYIVK